jgi:hypothetical protein
LLQQIAAFVDQAEEFIEGGLGDGESAWGRQERNGDRDRECVGVGVCGEREGSRVQREKLKTEKLKS